MFSSNSRPLPLLPLLFPLSVDNRSKSMVKRPERAVNVSMFKDIQQSEVRLPEQLALASYTFLSTQVSPFMEDKLHPKSKTSPGASALCALRADLDSPPPPV